MSCKDSIYKRNIKFENCIALEFFTSILYEINVCRSVHMEQFTEKNQIFIMALSGESQSKGWLGISSKTFLFNNSVKC